MTSPSDNQVIAAVYCSYCGAGPGERCKTVTGERVHGGIHAWRRLRYDQRQTRQS